MVNKRVAAALIGFLVLNAVAFLIWPTSDQKPGAKPQSEDLKKAAAPQETEKQLPPAGEPAKSPGQQLTETPAHPPMPPLSDVLKLDTPHERASELAELAEAERLKNDLDRAAELFKKALEVDPKNYPSLVGLAKVLRQRDDNKAAAEFLERALKVKPYGHEALMGKGDLEYEAGNYSAAYEHYQKFLKYPEIIPKTIEPEEYQRAQKRLEWLYQQKNQ